MLRLDLLSFVLLLGKGTQVNSTNSVFCQHHVIVTPHLVAPLYDKSEKDCLNFNKMIQSMYG